MMQPVALPPGVVEQLARAIHARYLQNQKDRKAPDDPAMQPWDKLPAALRESNHVQAAAIPRTVARMGYHIGPLNRDAHRVFLDEELELLAEGEHDRWVAERRNAGWSAGPARDAERKQTPYLVSWTELDEEIREYDRDAIRAIPEVLAEVGLGLFR